MFCFHCSRFFKNHQVPQKLRSPQPAFAGVEHEYIYIKRIEYSNAQKAAGGRERGGAKSEGPALNGWRRKLLIAR